jgi:hypothetical protein
MLRGDTTEPVPNGPSTESSPVTSPDTHRLISAAASSSKLSNRAPNDGPAGDTGEPTDSVKPATPADRRNA